VGEILGTVDLDNGATLNATGSGTIVELTGAIDVSTGSLFALDGARLSANGWIEFNQVSGAGRSKIRAEGLGSSILLDALSAIRAANGGIDLEAVDGGFLDFPSLETVTGWGHDANRLSLRSLGTASLIAFDSLGSATQVSVLLNQGGSLASTSPMSIESSTVVLATDGEWLASASVAMESVQLSWDGSGVLPGTMLADFQDSTFTMTGGVTVWPSGANLDGASILVSNGARFQSRVTSYDKTSHASFQVTGAGSTLDLSDLTSIVGGERGTRLSIDVWDGGRLDLSSLPEWIDGVIEAGHENMGIKADGMGSVVDLSSLTRYGNSASTGHPSILAALNGGAVIAPQLTTLQWGRIQLDQASTMATSQITSLVGSWVEVAVGTYDFSSATTIRDGYIKTQGGNVLVPNLTEIDGASFDVSGGVTLTIPAASYDKRIHSSFRVHGVASVLDLSDLTSIVGGERGTRLSIDVWDGGRLDLSSLPEWIDGVIEAGHENMGIKADGMGSVVDLSSLTRYGNSASTGHPSVLAALNGGAVIAPQLTTLQWARIQIDQASTMATTQITSLVGSWVEVSGGTYDFSSATTIRDGYIKTQGGNVLVPSLTEIDGASFDVSGGVTLTIPAASYDKRTHSSFRVYGVGSVLDLSELTSVIGGERGTRLAIDVWDGGRLDLSNLPEWIDGVIEPGHENMWIRADGVGSVVDLSAMTKYGNGGPTGHPSILAALNGGAVIAPQLTTLQWARIQLDQASSMATSQITSLVGSWVEVTVGTYDFSSATTIRDGYIKTQGGNVLVPSLTEIDGASFDVSGGVTLTIPAASYDKRTHSSFRVYGVGSVLDLSELTSVIGGERGTRLAIDVWDGGRLDLSNLPEWIDGVIEPGHENMWIRADGVGSVVDLSAMTQYGNGGPTGHPSILAALNGGAVIAPLLTTLQWARIQLDQASTMATSQITSLVGSWVEVSGGTYDFSSATTIRDGYIKTQGGNVLVPNLTEIDGASFDISGGVTLTIPATSYDKRIHSSFRVHGVASVLDLSDLTSVIGGERGTRLSIDVWNGGRLDLSSLPEWIDGVVEPGHENMSITSDGAASVVDLGSLTPLWNLGADGASRRLDGPEWRKNLDSSDDPIGSRACVAYRRRRHRGGWDQ
jgi:hypothetical protein